MLIMPFKACVHLVTECHINKTDAKVLKPPLGFRMCAMSHDFPSTIAQFVDQKLSSVATALSAFCCLSVSTAPTVATLCP